jgi:SSS family solute:Na+ symporter
MLLAILIAPHLGIDKKGGFQFIQEYTGFVSPGVFAMFILGFFWKRTTSNAALFATIGGFCLSVFFKVLPSFANLAFLSPYGFSKLVTQANGSAVYEIPFIDRMGFVFAIAVLAMVIISLFENRNGNNPKGLEIDKSMFKPQTSFIVGTAVVLGIITALYTIYW